MLSIVGYTNAGKSTLLRALTHADVHVEDKLFATLDPTSRRLRFPREREVIVTDTVGFIRDLPEDLKEAFRATLEELRDADLFLHVVDACGAGLRAPRSRRCGACSKRWAWATRPSCWCSIRATDSTPGAAETIAARAGGVAVSALRGLGTARAARAGGEDGLARVACRTAPATA